MQIWKVIASLANWNCSERDSGEFLSWWKSSIFCFLWRLPWAYKTENSFIWKFKICYSCCSVPKSCLTLRDPVDHSLPGPYVHGISQASTLEWVASSFSRGSSWPRDRTRVSCIGRQIFFFFFFTTEPYGKNIFKLYLSLKQWIQAKHSIH